MQARRRRLMCVALVLSLALVPLVAADSAFATVRTYDAQGQIIDYGCGAKHPDGVGWVCWEFEPGEPQNEIPQVFRDEGAPLAPLASSSRARRPLARKAEVYSWQFDRTGWYGIGATKVGDVNTTGKIGGFNGRQAPINSSARWVWGPPIRVEMLADSYNGQMTRTDGTGAIRPTGGGFTTGTVSMPTWTVYFHGSQYIISWNYYIRASGVNNPSSTSGTFHAGPIHSPTFYCENSLGSCYFP